MKMYQIVFSFIVALMWIFGIWYTWKNRKILATQCGHKTKIKDWVHAFGEKSQIKVPVNDNKTLYCHACLEKMTIQCAWCGKPIFIANPVTLYSPRDKNHKMPEHAVQFNKEHNSYVGCLRWDCEPMAACDRAGFWYPPGVVERVPSPIEMCLQNMREGGDGVIIVNDLSKR
jgi:hypothetical protein